MRFPHPTWAEAACLAERQTQAEPLPSLACRRTLPTACALAFAAAKHLAMERGLALAVHLAELPAELELIEKAQGRCSFLEELGVLTRRG